MPVQEIFARISDKLLCGGNDGEAVILTQIGGLIILTQKAISGLENIIMRLGTATFYGYVLSALTLTRRLLNLTGLTQFDFSST